MRSAVGTVQLQYIVAHEFRARTKATSVRASIAGRQLIVFVKGQIKQSELNHMHQLHLGL